MIRSAEFGTVLPMTRQSVGARWLNNRMRCLRSVSLSLWMACIWAGLLAATPVAAAELPAGEYTLYDRNQTDQFTLDSLSVLDRGRTGGQGLTVSPDIGPYAVRFVSELAVNEPGVYQFTLRSAEAAKLYINGMLVTQSNLSESAGPATARVQLAADRYTVVTEYYGTQPMVDVAVSFTTPSGSAQALSGGAVAGSSSIGTRLSQDATGGMDTNSRRPSSSSAMEQTAVAMAAAPSETAVKGVSAENTETAVQSSSASQSAAPQTQVQAVGDASMMARPARDRQKRRPSDHLREKAEARAAKDAQAAAAQATAPTVQPATTLAPATQVRSSATERSAMYSAASRFSDIFVKPRIPQNSAVSVEPVAMSEGLTYQAYMANGQTLTLVEEGQTQSIGAGGMATQGADTVVYSGYLRILNPGEFLFTLDTSGSTQLVIDDRVVLNGDGSRTGLASLGVGMHKFELTYSGDGMGTDSLSFGVEGPGITGDMEMADLFYRDADDLPVVRTLTVVNGAGSGLYQVGQMAEITANPPADGFIFDAWMGADAALLSDATQASGAFMMPDRDVTITAGYKERPADTFQLSVVNGDGDGEYAAGAQVSIQAADNSNPELVFDRWAVQGADASILAAADASPTMLTMPSQDVTVTAEYAAKTYEVVVTNGSGSGTYEAGQLVTVSANAPQPGEAFAQWQGAIDMAGPSFNPFSPSTTLTVPSGGITLTATYRDENDNIDLAINTPAADSLVDEKGFTVQGIAASASGITQLTINALAGTAATPVFAQDQVLSVGPDTGSWAFRFFDEDIPTLTDLQIVVTAVNGDDESEQVTLSVRADALERPLEQLLNRVTMGITPETHARAKQIGYEAFLNEQLSPNSLSNTALNQLDPDGMLKFPDNSNHAEREAAAYRLRYLLTTTRQLQELLAVYHDNHFNTDMTDREYWWGEYNEILGFREHALGFFRDLLEVSAKSPSMMHYLNNDQSRRGNINENYSRELLELHTVGVNGGYGPDDIISIANILTGWRQQRGMASAATGEAEPRLFFFDPGRHETADQFVPFLDKTYVGQSGPQAIGTGEELLDDLALLPQTASFNCGKLIQLFVNDTVSDPLLDACVAEYLSSSGNMGDVVELILRSPEFRIGAENYRAKFKTPLEYIVSMMLNFGVEVDLSEGSERSESEALRQLSDALSSSGQRLFRMPVPTGYAEIANAWASSGSLVERFAFALRVFRNELDNRGISFDGPAVVEGLGLETAEEIAIYFMGLSMGDRYTREEYNAVMTELLGDDGLFDITGDEEDALQRAFALMSTLPSFQYQ